MKKKQGSSKVVLPSLSSGNSKRGKIGVPGNVQKNLKKQGLLSWFIKYPVYLLVFLLPLFFLPFTFEALEFNKQYLLFFLVSLAFLAWLIKMVVKEKEIRVRRTFLDIPVLLFMLVAILATVFSVDKWASLMGFYGRFHPSLIGTLSFGM